MSSRLMVGSGVILYYAGISTDIAVAIQFLRNGDESWFAISLGLVIVLLCYQGKMMHDEQKTILSSSSLLLVGLFWIRNTFLGGLLSFFKPLVLLSDLFFSGSEKLDVKNDIFFRLQDLLATQALYEAPLQLSFLIYVIMVSWSDDEKTNPGAIQFVSIAVSLISCAGAHVSIFDATRVWNDTLRNIDNLAENIFPFFILHICQITFRVCSIMLLPIVLGPLWGLVLLHILVVARMWVLLKRDYSRRHQKRTKGKLRKLMETTDACEQQKWELWHGVTLELVGRATASLLSDCFLVDAHSEYDIVDSAVAIGTMGFETALCFVLALWDPFNLDQPFATYVVGMLGLMVGVLMLLRLCVEVYVNRRTKLRKRTHDGGRLNAVPFAYGIFIISALFCLRVPFIDIDECERDTDGCGASHYCKNTAGSFNCVVCTPGYSASADGLACSDINECELNTDGCADTHSCNNTDGSFECVPCPDGYAANADGLGCSDIDECELNTDGCADTHSCDNTDGSFECVPCPDGYGANTDGLGCSDIDECELNTDGCADTHSCNNTDGSFECVPCPDGYGANADGLGCSDIDECELNTDGCADTHSCDNTDRSFECVPCPDGYGANADGLGCSDINECELNTDGCADTHSCDNTDRSFECVPCPDGYGANADGRDCSDVDECERNKHDCAAISNLYCENTDGSFECKLCRTGHSVDADGRGCSDINECATNNGGCADTCTNNDGSYACTCDSGYELNADKHACDDVDECERNKHDCAAISSLYCENTDGSFECKLCPTGHSVDADGRGCSDINECATNNGGCEDKCTNMDGSYACNCDSGYVFNAEEHACEVDMCYSAGALVAEQKLSFTKGGLGIPLSNYGYIGAELAMGDLDGDGVQDVVVGNYRDHDGGGWRGAVHLLLLNADHTVNTKHKISSTQGGGELVGLEDGDNFGSDVAIMGDVDGNGVMDLAVGAIRDDDGGENRGAVYLITLMRTSFKVKQQRKISSTSGGLKGPLENADMFGVSLAVWDVDGNGVMEMLVVGSAATVGTSRTLDRDAVYVLIINQSWDSQQLEDDIVLVEQKLSAIDGGLGPGVATFGGGFGRSVACVGDLNDDGTVDVVVGAPGEKVGSGAVYVLLLNTDYTVNVKRKIGSGGVGGLVGPLESWDRFGSSIAVVGDLNGDGVKDLAVSAVTDGDGGKTRGAVYLLLLDADLTVKAEQKISSTQGELVGPLVDDDHFGTALAAPMGVLDGNDGVMVELAIGAYSDNDGGKNRGAIYVVEVPRGFVSVCDTGQTCTSNGGAASCS